MDNRKILIVNLSKGRVGEENSNFLGLVLVPKILVAAMSRQDMPEDQRIKLGENSFLAANSWKKMAAEYIAVYRKISAN